MDNLELILGLLGVVLKGGMPLVILAIYGLGYYIKKYTKINNLYIPWITLLVGGIIGFVFLGTNLNALVTGCVIGMFTVIFDSYIGKMVLRMIEKLTKESSKSS